MACNRSLISWGGRMSIPCVVCGHVEGHVVLEYTTPDVYERKVGITSENYWRNWICCSNCGMYRSEFSRDPEILHTIYEKDYRASGTEWRKNSVEELFLRIIKIPKEESETHFRVDWLFDALTILSKAQLCDLQEKPTLLDVGGASGVFAYAMKERDFDVDVIDPSLDGDFVKKYGIGYQQGYFGTVAMPKEKYNVISFLYVLEHLADPSDILSTCKSALERGGVLFLELPDASAFRISPSDHDAFNACHLWLFGAAQITELLRRKGVSVLSLQRYVTVRGYPSMMLIAGHTEDVDGFDK